MIKKIKKTNVNIILLVNNFQGKAEDWPLLKAINWQIYSSSGLVYFNLNEIKNNYYRSYFDYLLKQNLYKKNLDIEINININVNNLNDTLSKVKNYLNVCPDIHYIYLDYDKEITDQNNKPLIVREMMLFEREKV